MRLVVKAEIMNIRMATNLDRDEIKRVYPSAVPEGENAIVAKLAIDLLSENATLQSISLIAETDDSVVGHLVFSPVEIYKNEICRAYTLAPLAVQHDYQKRRIGFTLVKYGMQQLSAMGVNVVFVYGDPKYYGRFGFNADTARNYIPPYHLHYHSGWQALVLNECAIGELPVAITRVTCLCDPRLW